MNTHHLHELWIFTHLMPAPRVIFQTPKTCRALTNVVRTQIVKNENHTPFRHLEIVNFDELWLRPISEIIVADIILE